MTASPRKLDLTPNALTVLERRYLVKDEQGRPVESPEDLFWRVARTIAAPDAAYGASAKAVEALAEAFFEVMATRVWMPNSPTLMNAGRPLGQLSACFVLPVDDALSNGKSGIYDTLRAMALVHQSGGGTGFAFSRLRPKNDVVRSTMGVASGPVSFMKLYDASTDVVKQGGTRRGANMGILRVDHPDILEFITCKDDLTQVTNFNISVAVTDRFMAAVEAGASYDLIHSRTGKTVGQLDAREVFRKIVHGAWKTGEPGVFFVDRANQYNPVPQLGGYEATNPCGEQPLLAYDVCNLGSINVGLFVQGGEVDWDGLAAAVHLCTHFLDNVIDANKYPLAEIDDLAKRIRRIGLGIMGWADLLVRLGIPYNSAEGVALGRRLMEFVDEESKKASEKLAEQRGVFPEWERSIWGPDATCARDAAGQRVRPMRRLRNCNLTTVAPTGRKSAPADDGQRALAEALGRIAELETELARTRAQLHDVEAENLQRRAVRSRPDALRGVTRRLESPLGTMYVTITEDDVEQIYRLAYRLGCKGVTVYRDGARELQVLSTGATAKKVQEQAQGKSAPADDGQRALAEALGRIAELETELARTRAQLLDVEAENLQRRAVRSRPDALRGVTRRLESPLGTMYVTITEDDKAQPFEVFISLGKAGAPLMADVEAIGRLISLALRAGVPLRDVHRQLRGISSDRAVGLGPNKVLSVPDAIGIAIERWMQDKQGVQQDLLPGAAGVPSREILVASPPLPSPGAEGTVVQRDRNDAQDFVGACPDCGSQLAYVEGCVKCHVCGFSECG